MNRTTVLRTALVAIVFAGTGLLGIGRARARPANPLELFTGFAAKETCSCVFLAEQTDGYCTAFGQPGPAPVVITIDRDAKTATGTVAGTSRTARYSEGKGCITDALP